MFRPVISQNSRADSTQRDIKRTEPSGDGSGTSSRAHWIVALVALVVSLAAGIYIDGLLAISAADLHRTFMLASVAVLLSVLTNSLMQPGTVRHRFIGAVAALIAWRIAFFPLIVLAGCITSWVNYLTARFYSFDFIYPVFLVSFTWLLWATLLVAIAITRHIRSMLTVIAIGFGFIAAVVSFISPSDTQWLPVPDETLKTAAPATPPVANPYPTILKQDNLNWRQRLLMHIGSITYQSIPARDASWAVAVKGSLEQLLRTTSDYKSQSLLSDHYRAFSAAHSRFRR